MSGMLHQVLKWFGVVPITKHPLMLKASFMESLGLLEILMRWLLWLTAISIPKNILNHCGKPDASRMEPIRPEELLCLILKERLIMVTP